MLDAPDMKDWLVTTLTTKRQPAPEPIQQPRLQLTTQSTERRSVRLEAWAEAAFERETAALANCGKGGRNAQLNTSAFSLFQMVAGGHLDRGRVYAALLEAAVSCGLTADDGRKQVEDTIRSAQRGGMAKPRVPPAEMLENDGAEMEAVGRAGAAPALRARNGQTADPETGQLVSSSAGHIPFPLVAANTLAGRPVPRQRWLLEGWIPAGNVTQFSGDGGTGKSLLALQLSVAVATGGELLGFKPTAGKVLFVSAEDELDELHRRLAGIEPNLGRLGNLVIAPLAGMDASLADPDKAGILRRTPMFERLSGAVAEYRPELLVLDTQADLFGGDEIKKNHARSFIALLRELCFNYDTTCLLLSHPSLSGLNSGSGTSGNTAFSNSVRSRIYFARELTGGSGRGEPIKEPDPAIRLLKLMKANRAAVGSEIRVRYCDGQFVGEGGLPAAGINRQMQAEGIFMSLLAEFTRQNRPVSPSVSNSYAPTVFAGHASAEGLSRQDLKQAMERLLSQDRLKIIRNPDLAPSKHSRIVVLADDPRVETEDAQ